MKLTISQISPMTTGAVRIEQAEDGIRFYRFTQEQEEMYCLRNDDFYGRSFPPAGVCLRFWTNSEKLFVKIKVDSGNVRSFFALDVTVNGDTQSLNNFKNIDPEGNYAEQEYPYGEFQKEFHLGAGEKLVRIDMPWSVRTVLQELVLDDGATLIPEIPDKKVLTFGDSITHGADAMHPINRYISRFCEYLGAAEYCKAISGEFFWPELAKTKEDFIPDYITVAYGTNDWSKTTVEELRTNCIGFFRNLVQTYPNTKTIVITPVWRADEIEKGREIPLTEVHNLILDAVKDNPNAIVISGREAIPHDTAYYGDLRLHPNDNGFDHYYNRLVNEYEKRAIK